MRIQIPLETYSCSAPLISFEISCYLRLISKEISIGQNRVGKPSYVSYNESNLLTVVIYILSGQQKELYSNCFMGFFAELPQQSVKHVEQAITTAFDHFILHF